LTRRTKLLSWNFLDEVSLAAARQKAWKKLVNEFPSPALFFKAE
jgi:hypothetical protein